MKAIETTVTGSIGAVEEKVRRSLAEYGFGVLNEIDVAATLKSKLGVDRSALKILGACKPELAHQALEAFPEASLLLPCNVVLEDIGNGSIRVAAVDPRDLLPTDELSDLADEAAQALQAALDALLD